MSNVEPLRVGAVSYLNTKPLVYGLDELAGGIRVSYDVPSRLASDLAQGHLDVALIPSIEYLQEDSYTIVSDACIACRGPVLSVKLLSRVPMSRIRRLALDEGSRTSAALVRILLDRRCGGEPPQLEPLPLSADLADCDADALLVIGDRAIHISDGHFEFVWDLGDQWCRWAELPFVFAMWTARGDVDTSGLASALEAARDAGCANLSEIAARESSIVGLPAEECLAYLRDNLHFRLAQREQRGFELFYREARRLQLAPALRSKEILRFDDCKTS